jgi:hypothetical protein
VGVSICVSDRVTDFGFGDADVEADRAESSPDNQAAKEDEESCVYTVKRDCRSVDNGRQGAWE